ncbi:MAG TPA: hypothetical protein VHC97_13510 [Thermoanaerobaculia bacterium]|jgi:hypothetical protein|nr:hypothetical protein [Thermoanaerobaculia bacterium]
MSDRVTLRNAFSSEYLRALKERDEPGALAGDGADRLVLRQSGDRFGLFRPWRSWEAGDAPEVELGSREEALLFLAAWTVRARTPRYELQASGTAESGHPDPTGGHPLVREGRVAGRLRTFDPELLLIANSLAGLAISAETLALLLEVTGPTRQREVGEILGRAVEEPSP